MLLVKSNEYIRTLVRFFKNTLEHYKRDSMKFETETLVTEWSMYSIHY
jgi:hypothetical protein